MTDNWARVKLDDLIEFSEAGTSVNSEDRPPSDNELGILKPVQLLTALLILLNKKQF